MERRNFLKYFTAGAVVAPVVNGLALPTQAQLVTTPEVKIVEPTTEEVRGIVSENPRWATVVDIYKLGADRTLVGIQMTITDPNQAGSMQVSGCGHFSETICDMASRVHVTSHDVRYGISARLTMHVDLAPLGPLPDFNSPDIIGSPAWLSKLQVRKLSKP